MRLLIVGIVLFCLSGCGGGANAEINKPGLVGKVVRHRVDGRAGIVTSNVGAFLRVRFSSNYTSQNSYELVECMPFEVVEANDEDLYWRRLERRKDGTRQAEEANDVINNAEK